MLFSFWTVGFTTLAVLGPVSFASAAVGVEAAAAAAAVAMVVDPRADEEVQLQQQQQQEQQQKSLVLVPSTTGTTTNPVQLWPFHGGDANASAGSQSCAAHTDCYDCTVASTWCHWCASDQRCHAKGSVYGCFTGIACPTNETDHDKQASKNETDVHSCSTHKSCGECATASHFCHWCGHDNACHAIGSVYGCVTGVDCFSNNVCKRTQPEPFKGHLPPLWDQGRARLHLLVIAGIALLLLLCTSACYGCARSCKGAYDDLLEPEPPNNVNPLGEPLLMDYPATAADATTIPPHASPSHEDPNHHDESKPMNGDEPTWMMTQSNANMESVPPVQPINPNDDEEQPLLLRPSSFTLSGQRRRSPRRGHRGGRSMDRLCTVCTACYWITVAFIVSLLTLAVLYYPRIPQYNECNDAVAWEQLIESLKSVKVTADFEILMSVYNPNRLTAALDKGLGKFFHKGVLVGTFHIPPTIAQANAITDVLIVAELSPDKWEALSLTAEYYRGKLVLQVSLDATFRIPALLDYSFSTHFQDVTVNVNELSDRSLCACQKWHQPKE